MKGTKARKLPVYLLAIVLALLLAAGAVGGLVRAGAKQSLNPDPSVPQYYQKYATIEESRAAGNEINERIAEEGIALFKNEAVGESKALPLAKGSRVSLFGSCSTNLRQSGGGSGSGQSNAGEYVTTEEVFQRAGFAVNGKLYDMYEARNNRNEIDVSAYTQDIVNSYSDYNDAAIIFISRAAGGENYDAWLGNGTSDHSQQMNTNEIALFEHVKNAKGVDGEYVFDKIIVCINTADPFEVARYQDDPRVQGVIWMGLLGSTGHAALPRILSGEVNPSAHTVDIWPANLRQDPAWFNFADNNQVGGSINITGTDPSGVKLEEALAEDGEVVKPIFKALTYKEGIYMGYRWYETAATAEGYFNSEEENADPLHPDDDYYNRHNGVLYPFGYGLSYTSFEWTVGEPSLPAGKISELDAATQVTVPVTVKNTGDVAGKDVVQLYVRAPYDAETAPIEKSDITYIDSEKTDLLAPGESQTLNITFNIRDLASFDWNDVNGNEFKGYEIEAGAYDILLRTDSHTDKNPGFAITYEADENILYNGESIDDPLNYNMGYGRNAEAVFSRSDEYNSSGVGAINADGDHATVQDMDYVSRSDWKLPTPSTANQLAWTDEAIDVLFNQTYTSAAGSNGDKETDPWYKTAADIPGWGKSRGELAATDWKQASDADVAARVGGRTAIQLKDMIGVPFDDARWITFMNQMTFDELVYITQNSRYKSPGLDAIGKPQVEEKDGPGQISANNGRGTFWSCETTISATYNKQLAYEMGCHMGQECVLLGVYGWYGPGLNTHRLAFNGRNFEYYSSDGRQGGWMAAAVIKGAVENGLHIYAKHYVCNDMETARNYGGGVSIFLTEQALREIYLRPFEIATKYGNMNGIMTCHGRVGLIRAESHYYLTKYFLYDECGFDGSSVTDAITSSGYTTTIGGSAQQVSGDRLERCYIVPLSDNATAASSDSALNGRKVEGRYDAESNKLMVPEINVDQSSWRVIGDHDAYEENIGYIADVTNSGEWNIESPTQWYAVRMNAQYLLYQVANSAQMGLGNGDQVGVIVTLHYNDGVTPDAQLECKLGELISEPDAPQVNSASERFNGWYTDPEFTQKATFPMSVSKATHLYAMIAPLTSCAQMYDLNYDGAPAAYTVYYEKDTAVSLPPFDPVRPGYKFDGWYLEETCVNRVTSGSDLTISSDRTFYAKWTATGKCTVTFRDNYDGAPDDRTVTVEYGDTMMPPVYSPTREGYIFTGWYEDEYCEYKADFSQSVTYDMTLYAGWTEAGTADAESGSDGAAIAGWIVAGIAIAAAAALAVVLIVRRGKQK